MRCRPLKIRFAKKRPPFNLLRRQSPEPCTRCAKRGLVCDAVPPECQAKRPADASHQRAPSPLPLTGGTPCDPGAMLAALAEVLEQVQGVEGSWACPSKESIVPVPAPPQRQSLLPPNQVALGPSPSVASPASSGCGVASVGDGESEGAWSTHHAHDSDSASDSDSSLRPAKRAPSSRETSLIPVEARAALSNVGFFARTAAKYGIDPRLMARRLVTLMAAPDMPTLWRALGGRVGGLPLGLLAPVAPSLRSRLAGSLGAFLPPMEVSRVLSTELAFDGVHLTLIGLAGAVVAVASGSSVVRVPACSSVLTCPRWQLHTPSVDMRASGSALGESDVEGVWSSEVDVGVLYGRWPHLCSMLGSVGEGVVSSARAMLEGEGRGEDVEPGPGLMDLYMFHLERLPLPVTGWVFAKPGAGQGPAAYTYPKFFAFNKSFSELMGVSAADVESAQHVEMDEAMRMFGDWVHRDFLPHRAMASIAAWNFGLSAYQLEGLYNRRIVHSAGGLQDVDAFSQVPFFAVETAHFERYPSGAKRSEVLYLSSPVPARQTQPGEDPTAAQISALDKLLQSDVREVEAAVRRSGKNMLETLSLSLDSDTRDKVLLRLMMAMAHEDTETAQASAAASEGGSGSVSSATSLPGVERLQLQKVRRQALRKVGFENVLEMFESMDRLCNMKGTVTGYVAGRKVTLILPSKGAPQFCARFRPPTKAECEAWLEQEGAPVEVLPEGGDTGSSPCDGLGRGAQA